MSEIVKDTDMVILKPKYEKKYKCPYCDLKDTKINLIEHVEEEHEDMIPQDYTPARVIFNMINKKENGKCVECGKPTDWNEEKWKYNRYCSKRCIKKYVETRKARMIKVYGKEHLLNDENQQRKMLSNRSISGEYKFTDGIMRSYCGSYEQKLLEFCDTFLHYNSGDIDSPGPVIEYQYKGETHKWITDQYIIPANLVIDVKDGGDNPNNRKMDDYRAKQIAKENAIAKQGKYNYIRLTDNNFTQLLYILAEIKEQMIDENSDKNKRIVEINETAAAMMGAIPPLNGGDGVGECNHIKNNLMPNSFLCKSDSSLASDDSVFIVPCYKNNKMVKMAFATDKYLSKLYDIKDNRLIKIKVEDLNEYTCTLLQYKNDYRDKIDSILENTSDIDRFDYFYNKLTGRNMIDNDQLFLDENFKEVIDGFSEALYRQSIVKESLNYNLKIFNSPEFINLPILDKDVINECDSILRGYNKLRILQNIKGYAVCNEDAKCMSKRYKSVSEIPKYELDILNTIR